MNREELTARVREELEKSIISTEPADMDTVRDAVERLYRAIGLGMPQIIHAASLPQLHNILSKDSGGKNADPDGMMHELDELHRSLDHAFHSTIRHGRIGPMGIIPDPMATIRRNNWGNWNDRSARWATTTDLVTSCAALYIESVQENVDVPASAHYWRILRSVGAVSLRSKVVTVADRPEVLRIDGERRLHCEDGPAIKFRDGYTLYSWRGTEVPSEWIEDRANLPIETALTWRNMEQRNAAAEMIGWHNVLDQINCRVIDRDNDPEIGELLVADYTRGNFSLNDRRFLRVRCGTGRTFALPVPPTMRTALQAQAWVWGLEPKDFVVPEVRT